VDGYGVRQPDYITCIFLCAGWDAVDIPNTIASFIRPILGIWADIGQRRQLILGGGVAFACLAADFLQP